MHHASCQPCFTDVNLVYSKVNGEPLVCPPTNFQKPIESQWTHKIELNFLRRSLIDSHITLHDYAVRFINLMYPRVNEEPLILNEEPLKTNRYSKVGRKLRRKGTRSSDTSRFMTALPKGYQFGIRNSQWRANDCQ